MKILVYGAGVIGTLYAARLQEAGRQVTVLARGARLADIQRHGLVLEDVVSRARSSTPIPVTERLHADENYDVVLVAVRWDQLSGVMPDLAANKNIPTLFFLLNNPPGSSGLSDALGADRVLLGFPGAGGTLDGYVVRYAMITQQPTTLGEFGGKRTARLEALTETLRAAGFKTRTDSDMDAWLACHAVFVTSVCGAIYLAGAHCKQLGKNHALLKLMVAGVREGFEAVRAFGRPVHPHSLNVLFTWLPSALAVHYWRRFFAQPIAEFVFAQHARHAYVEMRALAGECRLLLQKSAIDFPALNRLYRAIDDYSAEQDGIAGRNG
jgi:2-dehydropantoate 2-reductase